MLSMTDPKTANKATLRYTNLQELALPLTMQYKICLEVGRVTWTEANACQRRMPNHMPQKSHAFTCPCSGTPGVRGELLITQTQLANTHASVPLAWKSSTNRMETWSKVPHTWSAAACWAIWASTLAQLRQGTSGFGFNTRAQYSCTPLWKGPRTTEYTTVTPTATGYKYRSLLGHTIFSAGR